MIDYSDSSTDQLLLFTAGGASELTCWKVVRSKDDFFCTSLSECTRFNKDESIRVMDLACFPLPDSRHGIILGCSDSQLQVRLVYIVHNKIFEFDESTCRFIFMGCSNYHTNAVLCVNCFRLGDEGKLIGTSDIYLSIKTLWQVGVVMAKLS